MKVLDTNGLKHIGRKIGRSYSGVLSERLNDAATEQELEIAFEGEENPELHTGDRIFLRVNTPDMEIEEVGTAHVESMTEGAAMVSVYSNGYVYEGVLTFPESGATLCVNRLAKFGEIPPHKTINGEEITGEGDIEISTLTPWQRSYLERQESTERTGKYTVSLGLSPSATEFTGAAVALTLTVTAKFDGVKVAAEITPNTANLNDITFANDKAEVIWPAPAISQGSVSVSYGVKAKYTDSDGSIEKTASASQTRYAPMRWVCKSSDSVPTSDEIKAGVKTVKSSAAGTYSIPFSQGDYVWLCIPAFMNISKVTSGGFDVPVEASQPAICRIGSCDVSYKCVRISGRPQTSPISLTIA